MHAGCAKPASHSFIIAEPDQGWYCAVHLGWYHQLERAQALERRRAEERLRLAAMAAQALHAAHAVNAIIVVGPAGGAAPAALIAPAPPGDAMSDIDDGGSEFTDSDAEW